MTHPIIGDYSPAPIDLGECLRYMGAKGEDERTLSLLKECLREAEGTFSYRALLYEIPSFVDGDGVRLGTVEVKSRNLAKLLDGSQTAFLLCATVGLGIDRLIARYSAVSPAKALCFQAIGAERIEALCDAVQEALKAEWETTPRYSPGYGDLSLDFQREIFRLTNCTKHLGITLNASLLMSPTKSVTAVMGAKKRR